ncbi:MAG: hypothetical protein GY845_03300 [Planctomycetes bacterium]|nr:hypothetical protein [Planctomycetota bacterium]
MAESIHTTLKNQSYVVNHQGNDLEVPLPKWLDVTDITDVEKVEAWLAKKTPEERLGFYHAGFDSAIIKGRAATRPKMRTINKIEEFKAEVDRLENAEDWHVSESRQTITKNIIVDMDGAIERSLNWVPKVKPVPGSGKAPVTVDKAIEMAESLSEEKLAEMLAKLQALQDRKED